MPNPEPDFKKFYPIFAAIAVISAVGIVIGSLAPFHFQHSSFADAWEAFVRLPTLDDLSRSDVVVNFWLGFPLSFGLCGLVRAHTGEWGRRLFLLLVILVAQAGISLIAELGQGWIVGRIPSMSDFCLQLAGAVTAVGVWQWIGPWVDSIIRQIGDESNAHGPDRNPQWTGLDAALSLVVVGILVWSVMPLDIIVSPSELVKESLSTEWVPFTRWEPSLWENIYQWLASFFLAVPIGLWLSRWLARYFNDAFSFMTVILIALAVGALPEICQFPIDSRVASATDALFGALGALGGILIGSQFRSTQFRTAPIGPKGIVRTPGFWISLAVLQAIVICAVAWMPFDFSTDSSEVADRIHLLRANPFGGLGGSDLNRGLTMFRQAALAGGLGAFLGMAVRFLRLRTSYSIIVSVLISLMLVGFSGAVELGQLIVDSRTGEGIGVFIRSSGALLGFISTLSLSRRA